MAADHQKGRGYAAATMSEIDKAALLTGQAVVGQFEVAGSTDVVPGVLTWTPESGASLERIDEAAGFPRTFDGPLFVVHAITRNGGKLTLLDAWLNQTTFDGRPTRVRAVTLAYGALVMPEDGWPRAIYSTAALPEWRNDSGIHYSRPAPRKRPADFRVDVREPSRDAVQVAGAELTFTGHVKASSIGYRPDFSMRTRGVMVVNARRPMTISDYRSRHGQPLLTLMSLAADRPDDLTQEVYLDRAAGSASRSGEAAERSKSQSGATATCSRQTRFVTSRRRSGLGGFCTARSGRRSTFLATTSGTAPPTRRAGS